MSDRIDLINQHEKDSLESEQNGKILPNHNDAKFQSHDD